MTSNGREPIDQRLDRLATTVEQLVLASIESRQAAEELRQASEQQRQNIEILAARLDRLTTVVVEDGRRFSQIDSRLDRLVAASSELRQTTEAHSQQVVDLRITAEAQERRLQNLEHR